MVFLRGVEPLMLASVSTRCVRESKRTTTIVSVPPTVYRAGTQRHAYSREHEGERPVDLQVGSNDRLPLIAFIEQQG